MRARHWLDCPASSTHGNVPARVIFANARTAGTTAPEAVLRHLDRFTHARLEPGAASSPESHARTLEVFFVADGAGTLLVNDHQRAIAPGDTILVPPGVEHAFQNDGNAALDLLVVEEAVADRTTPKPAPVLVRNYREREAARVHWNHLVHHLFGPEDGYGRTIVKVVRMEPMTTSELHGHDGDTDELWYMWQGCGMHVVDRDVWVQRPGMAIQVAPSDPGHALTNHTGEPLAVLYVAREK
jgi:mannose-6-phosphate isomerase-like protein (cupin superfamily)